MKLVMPEKALSEELGAVGFNEARPDSRVAILLVSCFIWVVVSCCLSLTPLSSINIVSCAALIRRAVFKRD